MAVGALAGAALATVAAGYVPVIHDGALRRRAELTRRREPVWVADSGQPLTAN